MQYIEAIQKYLVYALFSKGTSNKKVICMMKFGHYRFSGRFTAIAFFRKNGNKKVHRSTCCKRNRTIQMCFSSLSLRGKMKFVSAILLPIPHPLLVFSKSSDQQLIFNDILHYDFPSCNITNREKKIYFPFIILQRKLISA